jgi:hypothetical protein
MGREAIKVWDLGELTFNFLGIPIESGFGEGNVVTIEKQKDDFVIKEGADGTVVRSKTYSQLYMVKVIVLQTAAANALLSAIRQLDIISNNGAGIGPILIRDRQGLDVFSGTEAFIIGPPKTVTYAQMAGEREWTIAVGDGKQFVGGA